MSASDKSLQLSAKQLLTIYDSLFQAYGPQSWWPADTPFEVMVGAILTQNTAWTNVEKALANLQANDWLDAQTLANCAHEELAEALRPSGYFNLKARRLQAFCEWFVASGEQVALAQQDTSVLREALLAVYGVGPETADDMLLYAFERPVFVIDAYTKRLFSRLGWTPSDIGYEPLRAAVETVLPSDVVLFNEYHALIVRHAKEACAVRPRCGQCCLAAQCPSRDLL